MFSRVLSQPILGETLPKKHQINFKVKSSKILIKINFLIVFCLALSIIDIAVRGKINANYFYLLAFQFLIPLF